MRRGQQWRVGRNAVPRTKQTHQRRCDIYLYGGDSDATNSDTATVHLDGFRAHLCTGGGGVDSDLVLFAASDDRTDDRTAKVHLTGDDAALRMCGSGSAASRRFLGANDRRAQDATARIHLDAQTSSTHVGSRGTNLMYSPEGSGTALNAEQLSDIHDRHLAWQTCDSRKRVSLARCRWLGKCGHPSLFVNLLAVGATSVRLTVS